MRMSRIGSSGFLLASMFAASAYGIPTLQLDIPGGTYNSTTEDSVTSDPTFSLRGLLCDKSADGTCNDISDTTKALDYYVSIAVIGADGSGVGAGTNFGSFKFAGNTYSLGGMTFGTPPVDSASKDLPSHGIFDALYAEYAFKFDLSSQIKGYDTATCAPELTPGCDNQGHVYFHDFAVDRTGLLAGYNLHFDLYQYGPVKEGRKTVIKITDFAPFSHDASTTTTTVVTESGSLVLLAIGIMGVAATRRWTGRA